MRSRKTSRSTESTSPGNASCTKGLQFSSGSVNYSAALTAAKEPVLVVDIPALENQFARIGAKVVVRPMPRARSWRPNPRLYDVNVLTSQKDGEHFMISAAPEVPAIRVLNADPD